ncbi:fibrous sheath CABYR-binding protein-like isoform X1 [Ornithodoros turicata]|uniref:fibrous sheath CABYR-binding protein-like isoform X1 n=1 Tax=Ornithodoros turicata TaxID=34597 RepID=UPI003139A639
MSEDKQEDLQNSAGPKFTTELDSPAMFDDPALPAGWERKVTQRQTGKSAGKFDVYIFSPEGKKFRSRNELAAHFEKVGSEMSALDFDFSVRGHSNKKSPSSQPTPTAVRDKKSTPAAKKPKKETVAKASSTKKSASSTPAATPPPPARSGRKLVVKLNFTSPKKRILKNYSENKGEREQAGQVESKDTKPKEATRKAQKKEEALVSSDAKTEPVKERKKEEVKKEDVVKKNKENDLARKKEEATKAAKPTKDAKGKKMKLLDADNMLFKEFDRLERKPPKEKAARKDGKGGQSTARQAQDDEGRTGSSRDEVSPVEQSETESPAASNVDENGEAKMNDVDEHIEARGQEDVDAAEKPQDEEELKEVVDVVSKNTEKVAEATESKVEAVVEQTNAIEEKTTVEYESSAEKKVAEVKKGRRGKTSTSVKDSKTTEKATKEQKTLQEPKEKKREKIVVAEEKKTEKSPSKGKPEAVPEKEKKKTEKVTSKSEKKSARKEESDATVHEKKSPQKKDAEKNKDKVARPPKESGKRAEVVKPDKKAAEAPTLVEAEACKVEEPPHHQAPPEKPATGTTAQTKQKNKSGQARASEPAKSVLRDDAAETTTHEDPNVPMEEGDVEGVDGDVDFSPKRQLSEEHRPWPIEMSPCMIDHSYTKLPSEEDNDLSQKQSPSRKRTRSGGSDGSPRKKLLRHDPADEHEPVEEES